MTQIRQINECWGFGWIQLGLYEYGKIQLRYTMSMYWEFGTNRLRLHRCIYEASTNQVRIKGKSYPDFPTFWLEKVAS